VSDTPKSAPNSDPELPTGDELVHHPESAETRVALVDHRPPNHLADRVPRSHAEFISPMQRAIRDHEAMMASLRGPIAGLQNIPRIPMPSTVIRSAIDLAGPSAALRSVQAQVQHLVPLQRNYPTPPRMPNPIRFEPPAGLTGLRPTFDAMQMVRPISPLTGPVNNNSLGLSGAAGFLQAEARRHRIMESVSAFSSISAFSSVGSIAAGIHQQLGQLLPDPGVIGEAFRGARRMATALYGQMIGARAAALQGDEDTVRRFAETWLNLPLSQRRSSPGKPSAISVGLLMVDPAEFSPDNAFDLLEILGREARAAGRDSRLLTEATIDHHRVFSLDEMAVKLGKPAGELCPASLAAEDQALNLQVEFADPRMIALIAMLPPNDAMIVVARGQTASWEQAALACDAPPSEGERVRAKVRRLRPAVIKAAGQTTGPRSEW
jgi:hypothetical protein